MDALNDTPTTFEEAIDIIKILRATIHKRKSKSVVSEEASVFAAQMLMDIRKGRNKAIDSSAKWAYSIQVLLDKGIELDEIRRVWDWVQTEKVDSYNPNWKGWKGVILSGEKLLKHFDTLATRADQMQAQKPTNNILVERGAFG